MGSIGFMLMVVGLIAAAIGDIWILVLAFEEDILWGLGSLLLPVVALVYAALHWEDAKTPSSWRWEAMGLRYLGWLCWRLRIRAGRRRIEGP